MIIKNSPIENETFNHFRTKVEEVKKAIETLVSYNFKVIDMENQIIDKTNIKDLEMRNSFTYHRTRNKAVYLNPNENE
jgi:hypothetical protein